MLEPGQERQDQFGRHQDRGGEGPLRSAADGHVGRRARMRKIMLRFTAAFDAVAVTEYIQRALLASQSGAVLNQLDLSKTSAVQLQAYATITMPEEVKAEDVERWLTSQLQQAPSIPVLGQLVEPESRRLYAEAKVG